MGGTSLGVDFVCLRHSMAKLLVRAVTCEVWPPCAQMLPIFLLLARASPQVQPAWPLVSSGKDWVALCAGCHCAPGATNRSSICLYCPTLNPYPRPRGCALQGIQVP